MRLLTTASMRHLLGHRLQLGLSVLGVGLGVAVVLSIDIAIESARAGFRVSTETVSGRATHQITSLLGRLDEGLLLRVRRDAHVRASAPVVEGFASSPRLPGQALRVLGIDAFSEAPFRPFVVAGPAGVDVADFVTTTRAVVVPAGLARRADVVPGDSLPVLVGGTTWSLQLVDTLASGDRLLDSGLADVLLMDLAGAQDVLGTPGFLSRIDVRLADTEEGGAALARIETLLGPGESIETTGTRARAMVGMIGAFDVNLTALSLLALIFGMFLIYNAVTFSVVQRRELLGRLRAIGVTRREILGVILTEAAWIGAAGTVLGLAAGVVLARGLVRMVTRTINDLYFTVSVEGASLDPVVLVKAAALGLGATLLAALPPALEAAAAQPRLATMRSVAETKARAALASTAVAGGVSVAVGVLLLLAPSRAIPLAFAGLFLVLAGMALATPAATVGLMAIAGPVARRVGGALGAMASRGVGAALSRTAPAIAALVVAVSVTVGLGVMIDSFRATLTRWLEQTLRADVYVSLPGASASRAIGTLWPEVVDAFVAHPAVIGHTTYRGVDVIGPDDVFHLVALDLDPRGEGAFAFLDGDAARILAALRAGEGVIVSEPYAFRRGVDVGDSLALAGRARLETLPILGIFRDYATERGTVMVSRSVYAPLTGDTGVTSLGLFLAPGSDSDTVVRDLLALVPEGRTVVARSNDTLRAASLEVFERTFRVTAVLRLLAFIVAFVGVVSALMALQLERARELAVLRATGLTPAQVWQLVVTQTGLMGLSAGLLAVPVGLALSIVMVFVVNKRSFGWTLDLQVGAGVVTEAIALAFVGALLAGLYPAWRMARTAPALALRGE